MPFGRYHDMPMGAISVSYWNYLWVNGLKDRDAGVNTDVDAVADYIRRNLDGLKKHYPQGVWS